MPPGTPYHSFALPYKIRVDDFTDSFDLDEVPALYLLSHTHSDHITGLSSKSFAATVVCSEDAKAMLLRHEVYHERSLHDSEVLPDRVRTFMHLKANDASLNQRRDLLKPLPLNTPTEFALSATETVTVTLLDANHCPGAVMFLIEGDKGVVLHTGDFRAERCFLESIPRNPFLRPYLHDGGHKKLNTIFIDTAAVMSPYEMPSKIAGTTGLIKLMLQFPEDVHFFINSWTWGYEDVLKAIAKAFKCKIHADRYKHSIYTHLSDPVLQNIFTRDASSTRFHACEWFDRCEYVNVGETSYGTVSKNGKTVVYVNPVTVSTAKWEEYLSNTSLDLSCGKKVTNLLVALGRHSPLPELQSFVSLFRPSKVIPNTLIPNLQGLDWHCIDKMFAPYLSTPPSTTKPAVPGMDTRLLDVLSTNVNLDDEDTAIKNLIGDGALDIAEKWAESGQMRKRLEIMRGYLAPADSPAAAPRSAGHGSHEDLPSTPETKKAEYKGRKLNEYDSDEDSQDQKGRMAHLLFAGDNAGGWPGGGSSSPAAFSSPAAASAAALSSPATPVPAQLKKETYQPPTPASSPVLRGKAAVDKGKGKAREVDVDELPSLLQEPMAGSIGKGKPNALIKPRAAPAASFPVKPPRPSDALPSTPPQISRPSRAHATSLSPSAGSSSSKGKNHASRKQHISAHTSSPPVPISSSSTRTITRSPTDPKRTTTKTLTPVSQSSTPTKLTSQPSSSSRSPKRNAGKLTPSTTSENKPAIAPQHTSRPIPFLDLSLLQRGKLHTGMQKRPLPRELDGEEGPDSGKKMRRIGGESTPRSPAIQDSRAPNRSPTKRKLAMSGVVAPSSPRTISPTPLDASTSGTSIRKESPSLRQLVREQRNVRRREIAERVARAFPELVKGRSGPGAGVENLETSSGKI